jgi:hypothetical protein
MSEASRDSDRGPFHRNVEIGVALVIALFAIVVMLGGLQAGIGWAVEGPRAGFFPFYVGLVILLASGVNLARIFAEPRDGWVFASWGQLRSVMSVVVPTAIYVGVLPYLGIYISSALLIGGFMKWLGRYPWITTLLVAVAVPVVTYMTFERWFLVPLPKGPIEELLGL